MLYFKIHSHVKTRQLVCLLSLKAVYNWVRRNLRKSERYKNIYINEDITAHRSKILISARDLVRSEKWKAAYSSDGKIFLRDNNDVKYHITSESDLD